MVPKLLLLTDVAPGLNKVGRIYLRDLCLVYPHNRICCFHTDLFPEKDKSPGLDWLPLEYGKKPLENGVRNRYGHNADLLSRFFIERFYVELARIPKLVKQAVKFGKTHKVDMVWATLGSPTIIRMAKTVADTLNIPLITTVWDPPGYKIGQQFRPDRYTLAKLLMTFDDTIKSSVRCGVASDSMKFQYKRNYGTDCVVMIYGAPPLITANSHKKPLKGDRLVIGFAGSFYARDEWKALLGALESRNWRVAGRQVVLKVLSNHLDEHTSLLPQIEFLGWRDPAVTVHLLSQMDVAYLPYWLDGAYQEAVQLSFPGKLATYIAARLPVLFHGPHESSPMHFFERFPVGLGCHSLDHNKIIQSLEKLVTDINHYNRAKLACDEAYHQELSFSIFKKRFAELIGVRESELIPQ